MTNISQSRHDEAALAAAAEVVEQEEGHVLGSRRESEAGGEELEGEVFDKRKKEKVKQLLLAPIRKFEEIYAEKKRRRRRKRRPAVPFPYAYDDPAVANNCFVCCVRPPPVSNDLSPGGNPEDAVKPSLSSYRTFLKSLLEKNDFYSEDCNVHCDIRRQNQPEYED